MSVSGGMFSGLDNFKRTPLTGPESRRSFGSAGSAMDREARRLRRSGNLQGANQLATAAAMQRLEDRDRFGTSLVSREQRMEAEAADTAALAEEIRFKRDMRDAYLSMVRGDANKPASDTPKPTPTPTDPKTTPTDPKTTPTDPKTTPTDPKTTPTDPKTTPTTTPTTPTTTPTTTPDTGTKTPDTGIPMVGPPASADLLAVPTSALGKLAFGKMSSMGGSNTEFRQGLDRAIGMAKTQEEVNDLKKVAINSGITEEQFQKRLDFWNSKKKPR